MKLSKCFNKVVMAGLLVLATTVMGCSDTQTIGASDSKPDLSGVAVVEVLPESKASVKRIYLDGKNLKEGARYTFNEMSLTIKGNVPPKVEITGKNGQLVVTGNVGDGVKLNVQVPEYTELFSSSCTGMMYYGNNIWMPYTYFCESVVETGPKPPFDQDPTIIVEGNVGKNVSLESSTGTRQKLRGAIVQ